jgi:hypothetical protein
MSRRALECRRWQQVLLRGAAGAVLAAATLVVGCSDCLGSVFDSGERTIERREERDRAFEEPEGTSEQR